MSTANRVIQALEPFKLKQEKPGHYRCNSPLRPGANSMSFSLHIESAEKGAFYDHNPDANPQSGSLYDLAKLLNIPIPVSSPIEDTKRAYAGIEDYARAHGVTGDLLRSWHWRETTYIKRPALEFSTPTGLRWRFLDGAKPFYMSASGYTRCWYGLGKHLVELLEAGNPLVLCNGEISTITARYYGITSLSMTGGEKAEIPQELISQLRGEIGHIKNLKIIIAMDCDKAGRAAAQGLESQLRNVGFDVRAVDMGLSTGGDLADFCMLHTGGALNALQNLASLVFDVDTGRWIFATIDDILKMPPIDWLVPRQIPARGLTMLYGASGSYKSFFILDHSMRLALDGHNILYIAAEGEHGYRQRLQAWMKHYQAKPSSITFVLGQVDLFNPEEMHEFKRLIEVYKPKMIIVDTFAMCSGFADENSSRDMLMIVNGCKAMSRELDAVIVVVHHTNAEGKKERGSKVLRNACDTIIRVSLEDDMIHVQSQKTKDAKPFESYYLAPITIQLGYRNNVGEEVSSIVLKPSDMVKRDELVTEQQKAVLQAILVEPSVSNTDLADLLEVSKSAISGIVYRLKSKGYLRIDGVQRCLTPEALKLFETDSRIVREDSRDSQDSQVFENEHIENSPESHESSESRIRQKRLLYVPETNNYD